MKPANRDVLALALTWDGARWPAKTLPPKARAFLGANAHAVPSAKKVAALLAADAVREIRVCWVPHLKGGDNVLSETFPAPKGRRIPFRAIKTTRFGEVLGVIYRRS
jgi:hypothetical protein